MARDTIGDDDAARILRHFLEKYDRPRGLEEVVPLLDVAAKLVETAAYGAAGYIDKTLVVDMILIAAQLEAKATKFRGMEPV